MKTKFVMPDGEIVDKEWPQWKTPYNHDRDFESDRTGTYCADPSLAKQEFKEEVDINTILNRFLKNGEPPAMVLPEHFADVTERTTYYDMQERIADANQMFYMVPAKKRAEFQNDPTRWAETVVDAVETGDREALSELGIKVPPKTPQTVEPINPNPGGSPAPERVVATPEASKQGVSPATPSETPKK